MQLLARSRNIPKKYWGEVENAGKWAAYTASSTVSKQTFTFSAGKGGDASVLQFYIENNREQKKLDVFTMTVDHKFKLAPDVFVILAETSQFWGISRSSKIRFKKMPANIKQDQIQFISDYFSLVALQELAEFLKVEKGVPNMEPKKKASMDVAESDLADTWSSPKSQHLRATRTRWVNNLRQPSEKAVLKSGVDEDVGGYARNNAPFNTYGDENFEDVGGFYRTASGERVRIRRFGNKGYGVFRENGVREHHHTHGNLHNTVVFQKNGDHVVYHRRDGKVIKRVEFKRDSRHGKVSYGKKQNDPDMIMLDEDIGGYARNNAPFNTFADEDIGGYARNNAPFNTFADEDHSEDNSVGSVRCSKPKCTKPIYDSGQKGKCVRVRNSKRYRTGCPRYPCGKLTCILPRLRTVPGTYLNCVDTRLYLDAPDITTANCLVEIWGARYIDCDCEYMRRGLSK